MPTLAYHAVLILKNGVPCGYAESLALFERTEVGLNVFYTFRDGESAWVFARVLQLFRQTLGARVFSIEPYQLGFQNEEGIESGAFWFYRKLGFRPVVPRLAKLAAREEQRITNRTGYRTTARTLRELAAPAEWSKGVSIVVGFPEGDEKAPPPSVLCSSGGRSRSIRCGSPGIRGVCSRIGCSALAYSCS